MGVVKVNVDGLTSPDLILFLQHAGLSQAEFLQTKSAELIIQYKAFLHSTLRKGRPTCFINHNQN